MNAGQQVKASVIITTVILLVYTISTQFESLYPLAFLLFVPLHVLFFWMITNVLTKASPSKFTFDEKMYEDQDDFI
jgi:hypothetical protein